MAAATAPAQYNTDPPSSPVRLVFIHHSTGEAWLADDHGGLGLALRDNNYFVSDTNYGWGPDGIGDTTDIGHWWTWFAGPSSGTYLSAVLSEDEQHSSYSRLSATPAGPNRIVMFKSCFPNSNLGGSPNDPATTGANPLRGQDAYSEHHTVANAKGAYNDLLATFAARQDTLFVVATAPPLLASETSTAAAANARAFNRWLVEDWLDAYPHTNVAVFDFYNVLTSGNGPDSSDLGEQGGNHHRFRNGAIEYVTNEGGNTAVYAHAGDSHPTAAGDLKATGEYVPLLNLFYHCWQGDGDCPRAGPVCSAPAVTTQPQDHTLVPVGQTVTLTVAASGTAPLSYQWYRGSRGDASAPVDGATATSYTTPPLNAAATYWVRVPNACGHADSRTASLTVVHTDPTERSWFVPSVAHAPGAAGTQWRTDVAIVRGAGVASPITLVFRTASTTTSRTVTLADGATGEWKDVLVGLFGVGASESRSGSLEVRSRAPLVVSARTYNQTPAGTFGQHYPAIAEADALSAGQVGTLPQLCKDASFRTNVGIQNVGATPVQVAVRLHDEEGRRVGSTLTLSAPAGGWVQQYDVFAAAGAGTVAAGYATVEVLTAGGRAWVYASVVDAATGDPTTIPVLVAR